ncbi:MAG: hypothetical protein BroJett011_13440 [Chloroflexota bacterium]|nr:MAG: hypothetical protein BroJett011_13440 [Chloroflexota bacterium]
MNRLFPGLLFALMMLLLLGGVAYAQQPISDDEVNAVAKKLYCPVCENTPLDVCPTQACKDWRAMIRQQLSDGWTETEVLTYFEAKFGPQVLAQPPVRGFTVLVWILPIIGLAGGAVFLWLLLRRWQKRRLGREQPVASAGATGSLNLTPDLLARIEQEVEARF